MKRSHILGTTALALTMLSGVGYASVANAADTSSNTALPEIVVKARARNEKLLEVPVSVQAFSAAKLQADGITDLNTLQSEAGFTFNSQGQSFLGGGREFPTLVFRGMTSNYGGGFADSGALFVDGIYISGGAASVTLADAASVEVLKGPQNVYFGKNTFGGAVNIITSNPSEAYHAKASVGYSEKGSYDDVASVEGAILPGLLTGRVTGELMHQGAQYTAADGGPLGEQDTKGVTVVLYATPTPDAWLRTRFHYSHDEDSGAADAFISGHTYGSTCPGMVDKYFCYGYIPSLSSINPQSVLSGTTVPQTLLNDLATNNFSGSQAALLSKVPHIDKAGLVRDNMQGSVQGGIKLPYDATFQFSAGYNQAASLDISSSDHTPYNVFTTAQPIISRDFEADARIITSASAPIRFVGGLNYFRSVYQLEYAGYFFGAFANSNPVNEEDHTVALYASLDEDLTSYLTLSQEIRYQRDTISDAALEGYPAGLAPVSQNYLHALPRVIVKFHPSKETNVYLSYSEGVQPPQLQTSYITGNAYTQTALASYGVLADGAYTQDPKIRVWEIGLKQSLFDNRVLFSIDYYDQYWDNALVSNFYFNNPANNCSTLPTVGVSTQCPLPGGGAGAFSVSQNHVRGIEFEGTARVTPKFTAHAVFNWTDAIRDNYYDNNWGAAFTSGNVPSQNGKRIDLVPEFQGSLDGTYKDHLVGPYDWYAHAVLNYTGPQFVEAADIAKIQGFARVNLSTGVTRGNLTFEAFVTNLLDDKNWNYAVRFPDPAFFFSEAHQGVLAGAPNPRDFGFKISAKY